MPFGSTLGSGAILTLNGLDGALLGIVLYLVLLPILFRKCAPLVKLSIGLLFAYIPIVVSLTLFPLILNVGALAAFRGQTAAPQINWMPLTASLRLFRNSIPVFLRNVGGNVLLLMPLGFLVGFIDRRFRFYRVLLLGFLASLAIESLQLAENLLYGFPMHVVDVDDLIFNVLGCALGYGLFAVVRAVGRLAFAPTHYENG